MNQVMNVAGQSLEHLPVYPPNSVPKITVDYVPNEILRQIFLWLAGTPGARSALARVCYRWRQIVISTYEFSSVINIRHSAKLMRDDPYLWARKAGYGSHPLTVVWEINWNEVPDEYLDAYTTALGNFLEAAPYSRWRELRVVRSTVAWTHLFAGSNEPADPPDRCSRPNPINFSTASFTNLEVLELDPVFIAGDVFEQLMAAVTRSAKSLQSFKIRGSTRGYTCQREMKAILRRISSFHCQTLPDRLDYPDGLPEKIKRLVMDVYTDIEWDLSHVTHLEIGHLTESPNKTIQFSNVTTLYIENISFRQSATNPSFDFPMVHTLKLGLHAISLIDRISAPQLRIIYLTSNLRANYLLDRTIPSTKPGLPCTEVHFPGGVKAEELGVALSWFPEVESVSASLQINIKEPNMSLLCLKSDLGIHTRSKDTVNQGRWVKTFTTGPKLGFLSLKLPTFEDDYNIGLNFVVSVLSERRKSSLQRVDIIWEDERVIDLTTNDV